MEIKTWSDFKKLGLKDVEKFIQGEIETECPSCKTKQKIKVDGKKGKCRGCGATVNMEYTK